MKTNVSIIVSSEGGLMSEVARIFRELGLKPTLGCMTLYMGGKKRK